MKKEKNQKTRKKRYIILQILSVLLLMLGFTAFLSAKWYIDKYGNVGFAAIIYTLFSGIAGTSSELINDYLLSALLPSGALTLAAYLIFWVVLPFSRKRERTPDNAPHHSSETKKKFHLFPVPKKICAVLSILLSLFFLTYGATMAGIKSWLVGVISPTTIYEDNYVDPAKATITFPQEKRNLIYIYMESMETTFFSTEHGGARSTDVIPELYRLGKENTNFSNNSDVGGWPYIPSTGWTIASLVAQSSGATLNPAVEGNFYTNTDSFMPRLTTLYDILHKQGYYQTVMFGSDSSFAGRGRYYSQHGVNDVRDHKTAVTDGIIPAGYSVWWGMEDSYLYQYAKQTLSKMSSVNQPFTFTMLTADTHHIGGYYCSECQNQYGTQYENVYACASRQVYEFVNWIKKQSFYNNTTIIICGDHPSMDNQFFSDNVPADYIRHVYNCIINPAAKAVKTDNREFSPMDMFPTTLAALGCTIKGDRLGLGTNLFSERKTIAEENSVEWLNNELAKTSFYYEKHFY